MMRTELRAGATPAPVVSLTGITKRFGAVLANSDISLDLFAGEVHVLLGENGAGKSTLIGILSGLLQPDSGTIKVRGRPVTIAAPREAIALGIGTVFQHATLVPTLTVAENLLLGQPWAAPLRRTQTLERLAELSTLLGVSIDPDALAGELSLGEQQQIEIVKALWRGERVLILDEPTSMLTPQGVRELGVVLKRLRSEGMAIVLITHKLHEVIEFGDRVTILKLGKFVGALDPQQFRGMSEDEARRYIVSTMFGRSAAEGEPAHPSRAAVSLTARSRGSDTAMPLLELRAVCTERRQREAALDQISFSVRPGEIFGVAGVDGNGQKQLAEVIAGQLPAASGQIVFDQQDVSARSVAQRQSLGLRYLTDDRLGEGTVGGFSVALNAVLKRVGESPFWQKGWTKQQEIDAYARDLIATYDVRTPGPNAPIGTLSGGNIQKLLFGRELARSPKLVVYNKPTYGLDVANIQAARERIRAQARAGVAAVVISTELEELVELCDRVAVMSRGRLVGVVEACEDYAEAIGGLMVGGVKA